MAYDIGPKIGIEGEAEFRKAINDLNASFKTLGTEMALVTSEFDKNDKSSKSLTAQNGVLNKQIETQKTKLNELAKGLDASNTKYGENDKTTQGWEKSVNSANAELNKLERQLEQNTQAIKDYDKNQINAALNSDEFKNAQNKLKGALDIVKVAALTAAAAFGGLAVASLNEADELQKLSDVTGLSAERLQELKYAGADLGVEIETITGAQAKLTKSMAAAESGTGKQAAAFKELGISVTDGNGNLRDAKAVMGEAFTALNGVGNETERDAIAMQLFGKSAMELNPLIKAGGDELNRLAKEARDSGAVMSNEAIAGLDTFGDAMDHLKTSLVGKFGEAFAELAPTLTEFTEKVKAIDLTPLVDGFKWLLENATLIAGGAIAIGTGMAMWNVVSTIQAVVSAIKTWQIATKGMTAAQLIFNLVMMANPIGIIITAVAALTAGIIFLWNTNEGFRTAILETWKNIKDGVAGAIKAVTDTIASWKKVGEDIINGMIEGIKSGVAGLVNAIKNAVQSAITKAKSVLGIRSPSSVFRDQVGLMIGEGMAQGINNSTGSVNNAMNNLNRQLTTDANFKLNTTASQGKPQSAVRTGAIMNVVINVKSAAEATRELGILSKQLAGQF